MSSLLDENASGLRKKINSLSSLLQDLKKCSTIVEKLDVLNRFSIVKKFLLEPSLIRTFLAGLSPECELIIKSIIAIDQAHRVFYTPPGISSSLQRLRELLDTLLPVEKFYSEIGGIVGYHCLMLQLLSSNDQQFDSDNVEYHRAAGMDISQMDVEVRKAIFWGLQKMAEVAEIYPVGGAADRLRLQDEKTGHALPAAKLIFCGKTLLEGLISDLQAREYLHFKLFGIQICTPVSMMTSKEKDNHRQILSICEENQWFGRPKNSFRFFCQSAVPTMNKNGDWCLQSPMQLLLKPGGHGVIWKLARDEGVFDWLCSLGRKKALVRQINNPIASCDHGILAFMGLGCQENKTFGFASCPRQTQASEGVNVLIERRLEKGFEYVLTNIEYCDFKKFNIVDGPNEDGSSYSKFSSNTNILFIDLKTIMETVYHCPIPGMLINLKTSTYRNERGEVKEEEIARLESTMQNIADCFGERFENPLIQSERHQLRTYLTYNERNKTISTVKKEYVLGSSILETPEGCFLDVLKNAGDLLIHFCGMGIPKFDEAAILTQGPPFIFLYHPSLGPLYSIIGQKLRRGRIGNESELQLEISEVDIENLDIDGSVCIRAEQVIGHHENGILKYSEACGKCVLKNVQVRNQGIDRDAQNVFWKNEIFRKEACMIFIRGNGEFYAEDVCFEGNQHIIVEPGTRVTAESENGNLKFRTETIVQPSWIWKYDLDEDYNINLKKLEMPLH